MEPGICLDRLADRLRRWRAERGLTLAQLAARSGVAASTIHKIEVRKTVPTVAVLCRIADGLDRPITDFVAEDPKPTVRVFRADQTLDDVGDGLSLLPLGGLQQEPSGFRMRLAADGAPTSLRVAGQLLVVCEEGNAELRLDGRSWPLRRGDAAVLRSAIPLLFDLHPDGPCQLLLAGDVSAKPPVAGQPMHVVRPKSSRASQA